MFTQNDAHFTNKYTRKSKKKNEHIRMVTMGEIINMEKNLIMKWTNAWIKQEGETLDQWKIEP